MTNFHPAGRPNRTGTIGGRVSVAHISDIGDAICSKVAACDQVIHVLLRQVRTGYPRGAICHTGVKVEGDAGGRFFTQHRPLRRPRSDVSLDEALVLRKVFLSCRLHVIGGKPHFSSLHIDVAIAGNTHHHQRAILLRVRQGQNDVLESV